MSEHDQGKPKRNDPRTGKHRKKEPDKLLSKEERAQISRENGAKNDGSKSGRPGISNAERAAIRHLNATKALDAAEKLGEAGFRIRGDIRGEDVRDAAKGLGKAAIVQMTNVLMGKVSKEKSNAILKAALAAREEVCDPLVKETKLTGALTLEQLVSQAAAKARERQTPQASPEDPKE